MELEKRAFELEYRKPINEASLRDDIISYLGEYRFKVPVYDYEFFYSEGIDGNFSLRDKYDGDSMTDKAIRAIRKNEDSNRSARRETAELLGLQSLERQLDHAEDGDLVVWASPPGPKKEDCGDYGFVYIGSVKQSSENEKKISMTAVRIESPSFDQFNFYLSLASGVETTFQEDIDFLSNPFVFKSSFSNAKNVLFDVFNVEHNSEAQQYFLETIEVLSPLINELVRLTQEGASYEERKKALNTLENLASSMNMSQGVRFEENLHNLRALSYFEAIKRFGYEPEKVAGSCGASNQSNNNILSNNIFNSLGDINSIIKKEDDDMFECPKCHQLSKPPVHDECPKCHYTKQQALEDKVLVC